MVSLWCPTHRLQSECALAVVSAMMAQSRGDAVTLKVQLTRFQFLSSKPTKGLIFCFLAEGLTSLHRPLHNAPLNMMGDSHQVKQARESK